MHSALTHPAAIGFDLRGRSGYNQSGPDAAEGGTRAY